MSKWVSIHLKNFLGVSALLLSLAVLQSPLWRPKETPRCVTAKAGGTVVFPYQGELENAMVFRKRTATLSAAGPGKIAIHAHAPGRTSLLIRLKGGESKVYELVVLPG
jgi:hypothetical protein